MIGLQGVSPLVYDMPKCGHVLSPDRGLLDEGQSAAFSTVDFQQVESPVLFGFVENRGDTEGRPKESGKPAQVDGARYCWFTLSGNRFERYREVFGHVSQSLVDIALTEVALTVKEGLDEPGDLSLAGPADLGGLDFRDEFGDHTSEPGVLTETLDVHDCHRIGTQNEICRDLRTWSDRPIVKTRTNEDQKEK